MAVKGFYFSFDALMGLMLMALASTTLVVATTANSPDSGDIRFDQYSAQANDIANTMQEQEASEIDRADLSLSASEQGMKISQLIVKQHRNTGSSEVAEAYLGDYRHSTQLYLDNSSGLEQVYSSDSLSQSSSASFVVGVKDPVEMVVVVGE
ncbi:MAG: hypothetical protein R6V35_00570 [Candidatus Nanohaloarchaea archaeon]